MSTPPRPGVGSSAVVGVVAAMYTLPVVAELLGELRPQIPRLGVLVAIYAVSASIGYAALRLRRSHVELASPAAVPMDRRILLIVVLAGAGLMALLLSSAGDHDPRGPTGTSPAVATAFGVLAATVITPVVEEAVLRGVLYQRLRNRTGHSGRRWPWAPFPLVAVVASSVVFAASHYRVRSLGEMGLLVGVGVVLAVVYEVTGRLWVPIVIHGAVNLSADLAALDVPPVPRAVGALGLLVTVSTVLAIVTGPAPPVIGRDALRPLGTTGWRRHVYVPEP